MALNPNFKNVKFVTICCDSMDGARKIIEKDSIPRWMALDHYYMESNHKEEAKRVLGFCSVPFYVILDARGLITQLGNWKTVNLESAAKGWGINPHASLGGQISAFSGIRNIRGGGESHQSKNQIFGLLDLHDDF